MENVSIYMCLFVCGNQLPANLNINIKYKATTRKLTQRD